MFDTDELVINMGPQHPSTHGVLRVVLRLDGEKVVDADVVIGYLHRGIEKLSENRTWAQIVLLTDRMDYLAAATNNLGYCETVEKLLSLEVPRRARYVRTILSELQRIASHCVWVATHAIDIGAMTVFLYAFRERELILDLFEEYCGARLTYNLMRIGGLPIDIPAGWDKKVLELCKIMDSKVDEYEELLTHNRIWLARTNLPSRPVKGELLMVIITETVGSSTLTRGNARGASRVLIVSPMFTSSMPARMITSPGEASSTSSILTPR